MSLENFFHTLNNFHKRHGLTILYNEPKSKWTRFKDFLLKITTLLFIMMLFLSSTSTFSNNDATNRMYNFLIGIGCSEIVAVETLFWSKRKDVLELVEWCRKVETLQVETFHKPYFWFTDRRYKICSLTKFQSNAFLGLGLLVAFVGPIVGTIIFDDGYHLTNSFDFKKFSERDSLQILGLEFFICSMGIYFLASVYDFSFLFFIVFSNQVIGQLELIKHYIGQLDLNDTKKLRFQLGKVTGLHLDCLRTIKKLSGIYNITIKSKEFILYCYVSILVFANEAMSFVVPPAIIAIVTVVGLYCYACEKIMEAEEDLRNAYYELDWYRGRLESKKLLLLAMQEPDKVRFGRLFGSDHASMERFLLLIQRIIIERS